MPIQGPKTSTASPESRNADSGPSPRPSFYHMIYVGWRVSELSGPHSCIPIPTPAWSTFLGGRPKANCTLRRRGEESQGRSTVGIHAGRVLPLPGGEVRVRPEAAGVPKSL